MTDPARDPLAAALRDTASEVDERLAAWVDDHYTMEYPFQESWLRLHEALYGHDRKPVLGPCERCR